MTKKNAIIIAIVACVLGIIFIPISNSKLENYKKKEAEYNELKKDHEEFVQMCEKYKDDYDNLSKKYEQIQEDYKSYKEKFNKNTDLNKELEELTKKKEKYLNLIEEYSSKLSNL